MKSYRRVLGYTEEQERAEREMFFRNTCEDLEELSSEFRDKIDDLIKEEDYKYIVNTMKDINSLLKQCPEGYSVWSDTAKDAEGYIYDILSGVKNTLLAAGDQLQSFEDGISQLRKIVEKMWEEHPRP